MITFYDIPWLSSVTDTAVSYLYPYQSPYDNILWYPMAVPVKQTLLSAISTPINHPMITFYDIPWLSSVTDTAVSYLYPYQSPYDNILWYPMAVPVKQTLLSAISTPINHPMITFYDIPWLSSVTDTAVSYLYPYQSPYDNILWYPMAV